MNEKLITRVSVEEARRRRGRSDWARVDATGDRERDPDFDVDWTRARLRPSLKQSVTMRLDSDVLEFFREGGKGYQTRINAVLRTYMDAARKAERQAD